MAGLFDFLNSPAGMGLLSAVATGAAGARQGTPWNNFGRGAMGGLAGYANANDQIRQDEENAFQKQFRQTQMEQMQRQLETQRKQEQWRAGLPGVMAPKVSEQGAMLNEQNAAFGDEGTQATMAAGQYAPNAQLRMTPQVDQQAVQDYLMQPESPYADKLMERQLFPEAKDLMKVSAGDVLVDPVTRQPVYSAPSKDPEQDRVVKLMQSAGIDPSSTQGRQILFDYLKKQTTHAPAAQMNNYGSPVAGVDPVTGNPVFFQTNKGGGAPSIVPGVAPPPKAPEQPSEGERTAAGFLGRMQAAEELIGKSAGGEATVATSVAGTIPKIGDYAQRVLMTPEQQKYKQAADDWIRSKLRKESGAVIGDEEMLREYQTYFPQPGDTQAVIQQKAQARKQAEKQMRTVAGRAVQSNDKPRVGMVKKGYRFIGGDPANPKSWAKVNQ